ncbi:M43 family zinc metalloprotease [Aureibacter tunicatorum]|uniref:PKD domain-containing protein n=1 Tax=Aureibacter tunicatorum TaxID=866807 RepID=A0AAE3XPC3_9BACT|nr:M43 family zinc metalloprotease [Aureibacter tunicatorum]MDR6239648.1 hypothetical protein [Aureibacter tunicatorum]BDD04124.1 hypothetical protein AUTU_16070 [Aureibacter tunicatorum]
MKSKITKTLIAAMVAAGLSLGDLSAQNGCQSSEAHKHLMEMNPEYRDAFEKSRERDLSARTSADVSTVKVFPIVFHVIEDGGVEEISDTQLLEALEQVNEDFRAKNAGFSEVFDAFKPIAVDTRIEFRLAKFDPQGNPTTGINRVQSPLTDDAGQGTGGYGVRDLIRWETSDYVNIWVVRSAEKSNNGSAYAFYPTDNTNYNYDGVVISSWATGRSGTATEGWYKILTHELGHWANLPHVWGGTYGPDDTRSCSDDDGVSDTPNTIGAGGADSPYWQDNEFYETCNTVDNVQNFMDYYRDPVMFTAGQRDRMHEAMERYVSRNTMYSDENLIKTLGYIPDVIYPGSSAISYKKVLNEHWSNEGNLNSLSLNYENVQLSASRLELGAHFDLEGISGVTAHIEDLGNGSAQLIIDSNFQAHNIADNKSFKIKFKDSAFQGSTASDVVGAIGKEDVDIIFRDPYRVIYSEAPSNLYVSKAEDKVWQYFSGFGVGDGAFGTWIHTDDNGDKFLKMETYFKEMVCEPGTRNVKGLEEGTLIGPDLETGAWVNREPKPGQHDISNDTYTALNGKTTFIGMKIPVEISETETIYHYAWIKIEVSADGDGYRVIDMAFNEAPNQPIKAGGLVEGLALGWLDTQFVEAKDENDGSIEDKVSFELSEATFAKTGELTSGVDFNVVNLPSGLSAKVTILSETTGEVELIGSSNSHGKSSSITNLQINFSDAVFSDEIASDIAGATGFDLRVKFRDDYRLVRVTKPLTVTTADKWQFFRLDAGGSDEFGLYYDDVNDNFFKFEAYGKAIVTNGTSLNVTPLNYGEVVTTESSWTQNPGHPNQHRIITPDYSDWLGQQKYLALQFELEGETVYGWALLNVRADGQGYSMVDAAYYTKPDGPIVMGITNEDDMDQYLKPVVDIVLDKNQFVTGETANIEGVKSGVDVDAWEWVIVENGTETVFGNGPLTSYQFATPGNYTIRLNASNFYGVTTIEEQVVVTAATAQVDLAITAQKTDFDLNEEGTFVSASTGDIASYKWVVSKDGQEKFDGSDDQDLTYVFDEEGTFEIKLVVTATDNGVYEETIQVNVSDSGAVLSTDDISQLSVSPNPTDGRLNVQVTNSSSVTEITLLSLDGKEVMFKSFTPDMVNRGVELNLNNLSKGIYVIKVVNAEKQLSDKIVLK